MTIFPSGKFEASFKPSNLVDLLRWRASCQPEQKAYTFLPDGEKEGVHLTYGELHRQARSIAALLQSQISPGERVLLCYPSGLDYIAAFFGCLYANIVAVPTQPPRRNRPMPQLLAIVADTQATIALTTESILSNIKPQFDNLPEPLTVEWLASDKINEDLAEDWQSPVIENGTLAYLQYTSGSTARPKGVMVSHGNVLSNLAYMDHGFEHTSKSVAVTWLPQFHDMGLVYGIMQPLYNGFPCVIMPSMAFVQKPIRWLRTISRFKATHSGGPNFAYDLCVRKTSAEQRSTLDLSRWVVAFNGAEPIRKETLKRFADAFESCGFRRRAFYPAYGLAETTLKVSGGRKKDDAVFCTVDSEMLKQNRVMKTPEVQQGSQTLVGSGRGFLDTQIVIVHPDSLTKCKSDEVGEIWVSGPGVAQGYWHLQEETENTFKAQLDGDDGPFLRTGDLGFLENGELFITGRLKDLIIVRGRNYYPHDIERTVEQSHVILKPGGSAAFSVELDNEERLVIFAEVERSGVRNLEINPVILAIRQAVAEEHELQLYSVVLIKPGRLPKTSSGKVQRYIARAQFLEENQHQIGEWQQTIPLRGDASDPILTVRPQTVAAIQDWLVKELSSQLAVDKNEIDVNQPIVRYGLDSLMVIDLMHRIEARLGVTLPMAYFFEDASIAKIATRAFRELPDHPPAREAPLVPVLEAASEFPLSYGQRALWFLNRLSPENPAYNIARAVRIRAILDVSALRRAFQKLIDRHSSLRATFSTCNGEPVQRFHEQVEISFTEEDASTWSESDLNARLAEKAHRPFDLEQGPLLRVNLFKKSANEHILLLAVHHIVSDLWSLTLLIHELGVLYTSGRGIRKDGASTIPLAPLDLQYSDYVRWQAEMLASSEGERLENFWHKRLAGALPVLNLPTDRPRPAVQTYRGASRAFKLSSELTQQLKDLSKAEQATLYMTLVAAFQVLLHRYTSQEDLIVGSMTAGRNRVELAGLVGYFVNPVVLRADFSRNPRFKEFLSQVRQKVLEAFEYQDYPFALLVERLQPTRDASRSQLIQAMFVFQKAHLLNEKGLTAFALGGEGARMSLGELSLESIELEQPFAQFDLTLTMAEVDDRLTAKIDYNTDLFDADTINRMAEHYKALLKDIGVNPDQHVANLQLLTKVEQNQLLVEWCGPQNDYPQKMGLHQMFEAQVGRTPDATAVVFEDEGLSYRDLNHRANQLAHYLRRFGVGPDILVGVFVERSVEMVVGLLGILKAGGAYVPLDPAYPKQRLAFMLEDTKTQVLLTQERLVTKLPEHGVQLVRLDVDWQRIAKEPETNPVSVTTPENLAYVIYTSGSTGLPKGSLICHSNVVRLFAATHSRFHFDERDVWTLFHSYGFDFSVWEIWGALLYGGRLVVVPYLLSRSPESFYDLLCKEKVTVLNQTPSAFYQFMQVEDMSESSKPLALRLVILGGEALEFKRLKPWFERHSDEKPKLLNMYGITETTVHVTCRPVKATDVDADQDSTIGRPIPDLRLYLLDRYLQPVPIGIRGELYVGGAGLARGYLQQPGLTAEKFIPDPLSNDSGGRLYKTGDLARYLPNGDIEYLGRIDDQVKVRGFRIELGEIQAALSQHHDVKEAVVLAQGDSNYQKQLIAYVVSKQEQAVSISQLRTFLKTKLPEYMVPSVFVLLQDFPLTPNGKIDRNALPQPDRARPDLDNVFVAPRTPNEKVMASILAHILGLDQVGINDNFFDIGGDSIRAIQLVSAAKEKELNFSIHHIFQYQTISDLIQALKTEEVEFESVPPTHPFDLISETDRLKLPEGVEDAYPLATLQAGFVFHSKYSRDYEIYVTTFHLRAPCNPEMLKTAAQRLIIGHPMLRTAFDLTNFSEPLQLVHTKAEVSIHVEDLRHLSSAEQEKTLTAWISAEKKRKFDWTRSPLLRFTVHRRTDTTFQFTLSEPFFDGWSVASLITLLFGDYLALLNGSIPALRPQLITSYRDFVRLERMALQSQACKQFWAQKLNDSVSTTLARWPARLQATNNSVIRVNVEIPPQISNGLKRLAKKAAVPFKSVLLAAHVRVVSTLSGHFDVLTGLMTNGRPETTDGDRVLGIFLNSVPFRLNLSGGTWIDLVRETWAVEQELMPFRRYPLARLQKEYGGQPLFETAFNFTHFHIYEILQELNGLEVLDATASDQTYFALTAQFNLDVSSSDLRLYLDCNANQLCNEQIDAVSGYYLKTLTLMAEEPTRRYESVCLLSEQEQQTLLEWNKLTTPYPQDDCIHEIIETRVQETPDAIAVVFEDQRLTYNELNRRANQLAHYLQKLGVGPDTLVGICVERSAEMVVGLLGILKAGGAYIPMDVSYPKERLAFMLADAQVSVLLTQDSLCKTIFGGREAKSGKRRTKLSENKFEGTASRFSLDALRVICLDSHWETIAGESEGNPKSKISAQNLAYAIFTSGSTGEPKGVMVSHKNVVHLFAAVRPKFHFDPSDVWTLFHSYSFDFSVWELWGALLHGSRLVLVPDRARESPAVFHELLRKEQVSVLNLTPSAFRLLMAEAIKEDFMPERLILGGEALPKELATHLLQEEISFWNFYGPTEATVWSAFHKMASKDEVVSVGHAIANTQLFILDRHFQPVPVGVAGELHIGGVGLARGYLNRPELTAEKFIPNPCRDKPGSRLYKTGDLARYLPDGKIEYLGRIDHQVKIRGFRIEPGEIEAVLGEHYAVKEVAVVAREDGEKRLVAYIVPNQKLLPTTRELRRHLFEKLPEYMIPSAFVCLEALPLTSNGKIDRNKLPAPDPGHSRLDEAFVSPRTPVEKTLATIWADVLKLKRVGIEDNFFELGGDSILSIQIVARSNQEGLKFTHKQLFQHQTISAIVQVLETAPTAEAKQKRAAPLLTANQQRQQEKLHQELGGKERIEDIYPLTPMQEGILFHTLSAPKSGAYFMQANGVITGALDIPKFKQSWQKVVERHAVLRTAFFWKGLDRPLQAVFRDVKLSLEHLDWRRLSAAKQKAQLTTLLKADLEQGFELSNPPLMRIVLVQTGEHTCQCIWSHHHLLLDGWSMYSLLKEVFACYEAFCRNQERVFEQAIPFRNYISWIHEQDISKAETFWRKALKGFTVPTSLGFAHLDGPKMGYDDKRIRLSEKTTAAMQSFVRRHKLTMNTLVQGAWALLLSHYSGADDVVYGATVSGRPSDLPGVESLVGLLINTLPVRIQVSDEAFLLAWLKKLQNRQVGMRQYEYTPLAEVRKWSEVPANQPLFESIVVFENFPAAFAFKQEKTDLEIRGVRSVLRENYPLVLVVVPGSELSFQLKYDCTRFDPTNITLMLKHLERLLSDIFKQPDIRLKVLKKMLAESDRQHRTKKQRERKQVNLQKLKKVKREVARLPSETEEQQ